MFRAVVRRTFLTFEEDTDDQLPHGDAPLRRSKSAGDDPECARVDQQEDDLHLRRLTDLLRKDPASPGHLITPLPAPAGGVEVQELLQLQQRLREAASPRAALGEAPCCKLSKVTSIASVSTMVPEDADAARGIARPLLRNVDSSNSISSMISDWARPSLHNVGSSNSVSTMVEVEDELARLDDEERTPGAGAAALGVRPGTEPQPGAAQDAHLSRRGRSQQVLSAPPKPKDYCHNQVPKKCDLAKDFARAPQKGPPTTMMIRNIPNHYTQSNMVRELEGLGFQNSYDFLYVPIDKGTLGSVGYCFVNFVNPDWAARCAQVFDGRPFERQRRDRRGKVAVVSVAHLQGLEANMRHYRNAAVTGTGQQGKGNGPVVIASLARALG